jgi:hypothetical protein
MQVLGKHNYTPGGSNLVKGNKDTETTSKTKRKVNKELKRNGGIIEGTGST